MVAGVRLSELGSKRLTVIRGSLVTDAKKDGGLYLMSRKEEEVMCAFFNLPY